MLFLFLTLARAALPYYEVEFFYFLCANTNIGNFSKGVVLAKWCDTNTPICDWNSIACNAQETSVIVLSLETDPGDLLTGFLPSTFSSLPNLLILTIDNTALVGDFGPQLIGENNALKSVRFKSTPIGGNFSFDYLPAGISSVYFEFTKISGTIGGNVGRLTGLEVLVLSGSGFVGTLPAPLLLLDSLDILNITSTRLTGALPDETCIAPQLSIVDLSRNWFTSRPDCLQEKQYSTCTLTNNLFCVGPLATDGNCTVDLAPRAFVDQCGVCSGNGTSCTDCSGAVNGTKVRDICGTCNGGVVIINDCPADCFHVPNGKARYDVCDVCGGQGRSCLDCKGVPNGPAVYDVCDVCDGAGDECIDCHGVLAGTSRYDACDVCDGDSSTCSDCAGVVNGPYTYDFCDVCNGHDHSCADCARVPYGTHKYDRCDICGGDDTLCGLNLVVPAASAGITWFIVLGILLLCAVVIVLLIVLYQRRRRIAERR